MLTAYVGLSRVFRCLHDLHTHTHTAIPHLEAEVKESDGNVLRSDKNAGFCVAPIDRVK